MTTKTLHIIAGPTAIGKTDKAIELALELQSEIISADSRQVYQELNIAVAKPDAEQLAKVKHHLIGHVSIHDDYSTGSYINDARNLINQSFLEHDDVIVCGGTGLYIQSLLSGLDTLPEKNDALREELKVLKDQKGVDALADLLYQLNPQRHADIDLKNPQRLIRAIEIEKSGLSDSSKTSGFEHSFNLRYMILETEREILYNRINQRVDKMIEAGLEEEAREMYAFRELNALQTVGYSEWWPYFEERTSKTEVIEKIKQHTRNYAKRQMTWFRNRLPDFSAETAIKETEILKVGV